MSRFKTLHVCLLLSTLLVSSSFAQEAAKPVFVDGEAQEVDAFKGKANRVLHDLWVETEFDSDGNGTMDRMHVDVARPIQTDTEGLKVPVIYNTSPYFAGTAGNAKGTFWDPKHEIGETPPEHKHPVDIKHQSRRPVISNRLTNYWVSRGFAVVHSCSPGTGLSQGCVTIGGDNECLAPKAVIDWLNGRAKGFTEPVGGEEVVASWCTGKVGMTGTSYNGTLPIAAATTGVEGLECIIPVAPNTSYYHYYRSNGLVRHPGGYMGEDVDVLYDFVNSGPPEMREHCDCEVRDEEILENIDRESGDYSDWWAGRDYVNKLGKVKAATLIAHGLNDWNVMPAHSIRVYEALKKQGTPAQIYLHQGGHGGTPTRSMMNRWFSRYLYDIENGVEDDPRAFIVREGAEREDPTAYPDYPNPDAKMVTLYPSKGGLKVGGLSQTKAEGQGSETLTDDVSIGGDKLAAKTESENRLLFATAPLSEAVHISGTSKLKIRLSCDKPAANLSVWIVSLPWDKKADSINANLITRGWADPQNHSSLTKGEPLEPGKFYDLEFDLQPDDQIIPAGQQIGLMIFSSDRDFTLWPDPGTKLTVDLDATSLTLPIVGNAGL
ncbi:Xaa-Pro dipeptidyl-peptidase [Mariniblastus fucicola]|uniref:Xaa-Pro dipeptidyl-peptidase n=1 Tax=Mariniblastus fucicola TaxID=980251 RepID=A0A5B9P6P8_9BACT|nr:Xaa-Pro dipeptidyl-peptidase [Mariniblastus fucicola]QEG20682.1 Xaa-Pro dipeptidyl-peptidase [Mariniblastus fucicola]